MASKKGVREDIIARYGITPLDFMMKTIVNTGLEYEQRLDAAKSAAPYVHARLKQIEITDDRDTRSPQEIADALEAALTRAAGSNLRVLPTRKRDLIG